MCKVHLMPAAGDPVLLFLPARDEVATVAQVLARTPRVVTVDGRDHPVRTLVVDDGSSDGTGEAARACGAEVVRTDGLGLGAAVGVGLAWGASAGAAVVAFCDADLEYDPAELETLVRPVLAGTADYVVGSRFLGGARRMKPHRALGNRFLTALTAATTTGRREVPLTDGQSGYRALSREAAAAAVVAHDYNYAQVLTLDLLGRGFRYLEVPITYAHRQVGRSFVRLPTYLRRVLPAMWRVRRSWAGTEPAPFRDAPDVVGSV